MPGPQVGNIRGVSRETSRVVAELFGGAAGRAAQYVEFLITAGVERGLLGPREAARIWERHIFNCAAVAPALRRNSTALDVGSGAGLPGIVLALARPDVRMLLVEPLQRRVDFLLETVTLLALENVEVRRARAEELHGEVQADIVTARAVAPLARLVAVTLPLVAPGGAVLAFKGARAAEELADAEKTLRRLGAAGAVVEQWGGRMLSEPTTVVRISVAG